MSNEKSLNLNGSATDFTNSTQQLTSKFKENYEDIDNKPKPPSLLSKLCNIVQNITVEPCILCYMLSTTILSITVQNMNLEKACRVNLAYEDEVCDNIIQGNTDNITKQVQDVQTLVANVVSWKMPLQTFIPALMVIFVGAWSDRTNRRKICILTPMVGEVITNIGLILCTYYFYEWSLETTALIEALPSALTGGWIITIMGMYSYMTDITTVQDRTVRLGIVTIFVSFAYPVGIALSGILTKTIGYYGVFSLLICLNLFALTYGVIRLQDKKLEVIDEKSENTSIIVLAAGDMMDTFKVAIKIRQGTKRLQIFLVLFTYFIMVGPLYGESNVAYLYAAYKFRFTLVEYSVYSSYNVLLGLCGTIFAIAILSKVFNIHDGILGAIAGTSRVFACILFALAPTRGWFYAAPALNIFSHTGLTAVRAIATKLVASNEVAKLSSLIALFEAFAPVFYTPASNSIYVATLDTLPGAFYLMEGAITIVGITFFILLYKLHKKDEKTPSNPKEKEKYAITNPVTTL